MSEPLIGQIITVGFNFAPRQFADCSGQLLAISTHTALFSLLGTTYGGDGRTTFALPDLRGRAPIHAGAGPGLSHYSQGMRFGLETVQLNQLEIPAHTHSATQTGGSGATVSATSNAGTTNDPSGGKMLASPPASGPTNINIYANTTQQDLHPLGGVSGGGGQIVISNTGGSQSHENRAPRLTLRFCIALSGIFPSRN
jgi:microcystin-dependent protein